MEESTTTVATLTDSTDLSDETTVAPTIEQLTLEVKFYLNQMGQNIIEVGKRLNQAKSMLAYGEWHAWLKDNFNLSYRSAKNFIDCADRFGKISKRQEVKSISHLNSTQMIAMLALPEAETEAFIESKAAEGTPVESMTVKKLREEIQSYKERLKEAEAVNRSLDTEHQELIGDYQQIVYQLQLNQEDLQSALDQAEKSRQSTNEMYEHYQKLLKEQKQQGTVTQVPEDYEPTKKELATLKLKAEALQKQLDERPIEVQIPADYESNKQRIEELQATIARTEQTVKVEQYIRAIFDLVMDLLKVEGCASLVEEYAKNNPDFFGKLNFALKDIIQISKYAGSEESQG